MSYRLLCFTGQSGLDFRQMLNSIHRQNFPIANSKPFAFSSLFIRDYNLATLSIRADMEAIKDSHARICRRWCQLDAGTVSKEDRDKHTQFDHDKVDCDASPGTRGKGLELILDQGFALRRREPACMIKSETAQVNIMEY